MQNIKTSTPKPIPFTTVSVADLQTRLDASTLTFTVRVIKSNSTSVAGGGSGGIGGSGVTQPDVTNAPGCCLYTPSAGDIDTNGPAILRISGTGATNMEPREIPLNVVPWDPYDAVRMGLSALRPDAILSGHAVTGTLTATAFSTDLTIAAGQFANEAHCRFATGALAGQVQKITGYSGGVLSFTTGFSAAPANGDLFVIVNG